MGYRTTRTQTAPVTEPQERFLRSLARWQGVASPQDLPPQISQADNAARQYCKRKGWVTFDGSYWRLTDSGRKKLRDLNMSAQITEAADAVR